MARVRQGRTLVEDVYNALLVKIVFGAIVPGARLPLQGLSAEFGVSPSVVREAVTRLASEELVVATPQQGFRVRALSVPHLLDLTWMRKELEALALRHSIEKGDIAWEADLVAAHHTLIATRVHSHDGTVEPAWMIAHGKYHAALVSACGSPLLIRTRQQLFQASEIYRYWADRVRTDVQDDVPREHTALLDAALARDANRAVMIATEHIQRTTQHLLNSHQGKLSDNGEATG